MRVSSRWDSTELVLLQVGMALLGVYFALGVVAPRAYAWPLLMGPGPFFALFCFYLATRLQRRSRHLYALVRFATVYSVPYALLALASGHSSARRPSFTIGDLPPILLTITLALRLRAWRRLFDAPLADGVDERRALLAEVFAGFGTWAVSMCCLSFIPQLDVWARASDPKSFLPVALYTLMLVRLMTVSAFAATVIGWGLFRSRGARPWVRATIAFLVVMVVVHGTMLTFFVSNVWSAVSGASWTLVVVGFAVWVGRWHRTHPPTPLPGAPHVF